MTSGVEFMQAEAGALVGESGDGSGPALGSCGRPSASIVRDVMGFFVRGHTLWQAKRSSSAQAARLPVCKQMGEWD
jgi:hypothetical protein